MATVEKPSRVHNIADARKRVLDPLQRLRGYIRMYVTLEALAIVLLYAFTCFWISLAFDYGAFIIPSTLSAIFPKQPFPAIDWVQVLDADLGFNGWVGWCLRLLITMAFVLLLFAIVASKAINRLLARFRDISLALELERRFPKILGDRLITAIELANRRKVEEQGYSTAMVDETVVEAAHRVDKLPIKEVFRWGRLYFMAFLVFFLSVVVYSFTVAGFCVVSAIKGEPAVAGIGEFHDVATIWFERNVLLQNTIWPRRSYLVIVEPSESDLRMGRDTPPPPLRVRALEYVIADRNTREGWRALTWHDLEKKPDVVGDQMPVPPGDWKLRDKKEALVLGCGMGVMKRNKTAELTVDEVRLHFTRFNIRNGAPGTAPGSGWVIYDAGNERWRSLEWRDLASDTTSGMTVPNLPASWETVQDRLGGVMGPAARGMEMPDSGWETPQDTVRGYTVDEVAKTMSKSVNGTNEELADVRNALAHLDRLDRMRQTMDKLDARLADKTLRRSLRRLQIPTVVTVVVQGPTTNNTMTLTKLPDNEFTGQFGELKEKNPNEAWKFRYYARGEDYGTPWRRLTLVPPPGLAKLEREDERPAYNFYRPGGQSDAKVEDIKGKKQPIERSIVTLQGGDVVTIDCDAGTDLTLYAEADKDLTSVKLFQPKGGPEIKPDDKTSYAGVTVQGRAFTLKFNDVRQAEQYFDLQMIDTDKVVGLRRFRLRATRDAEPSVDLSLADWLRKTKDGIMVTPKARIGFSGDIKDDRGLAKVNYAYTVAKIESTAVVDVKALVASGVIGMISPNGGGVLHGNTFLAGALHEYELAKSAQAPGSKDVKYYPEKDQSIDSFNNLLTTQAGRRVEYLALTTINEMLAKRQSPNHRKDDLIKSFPMRPDNLGESLVAEKIVGDFNLETANLVAPSGRSQPRYRVMLWVEATDTDLDSSKLRDGVDGPKIGQSKERYPLLVVAEEDLLIEIAKDEGKMSGDMSIMFDRLLDVQSKLGQINLDLGSPSLKPENLSPMSVRTESLVQSLDSAHVTTKEVLMKYKGLFQELKCNQVESNKIKTVLNDIIRPLEEIDRFEFDDAKEKIQDLRKQLDNKEGGFPGAVDRSKASGRKAKDQVQVLIDKVRSIMDKMEKEIQLNKIIEDLRKIEQQQQKQYELIEQIRKIREQQLLEGTLKP